MMEPVATSIQALAADIIAAIVDGVIVTDGGGQVLIWNRAAEELTGIAASDAVGSNIESVLAENPAMISVIRKTFSSGRSYSDYEAEFSIRHGAAHPIGIVTTVLTDSDGMPTGVILTMRDQAGMRDLKERMRRSDRLATIGMIAAGIAHEVKNPLVGISGAAQLMKSELVRGENTKKGGAGSRNLTEYLDVILKESDRLNNVLEGILDFTRLKARQFRPYNIHSILDRALLLNEDTARRSNVTLIRLYDPSLPDVLGNEDQLIQVFLNVIKNAIEAMNSGGKVRVVTRMSDQFTSIQADGRKYKLMVVKIMDTGPGIKPEHLNDVFTPFFTTKDKGVGLGLALSYQIIQEHLGTIRVESRKNEGATFSIYLPLAG